MLSSSISLGILALTSITYATRDLSWRSLYLSTSIPGIGVVLCLISSSMSPPDGSSSKAKKKKP